MTVWPCSRRVRRMAAKLFHLFQISVFEVSVPTNTTLRQKSSALERETSLESGASGSKVLPI